MHEHITEFQARKFHALFDQLDDNKNGVLGFDDFAGHAHQIKATKSWGDDHPDFTRLMEAKAAFWKELHKRASTKGSDEISRDEWTSFWSHIAAEVKQTGVVPPWVTRIHFVLLTSLDLDGDGKVSLDEYSLYLKSIGSDADPRAAFQRFDANGNGTLELEELEDIFSQWILSQDPNDPGNYFLLGRL